MVWDGEGPWQCFHLGIKLNAFRQSIGLKNNKNKNIITFKKIIKLVPEKHPWLQLDCNNWNYTEMKKWMKQQTNQKREKSDNLLHKF